MKRVPPTKGERKNVIFFPGLLKNYASQIILVYLTAIINQAADQYLYKNKLYIILAILPMLNN